MSEREAIARSRPPAGEGAGRSLAFPLGVAAAAIAGLLTHLGSLSAPFFADDWLFLDQVRSRSLLYVLGAPDPLGNYFRPLGRQVWFWVLAHAGGESPLVFHAANLVCLLVAVVLLAFLARRVAGPFAGVVAGAFFALHYAGDVPVLWVSGSQELLSLTFALAAISAHVGRRRALAAVLMFLALLAKEAVVLAPLVAIALDDTPGTLRARVRRAWPLAAAVLAWFVLAAWVFTRWSAHGAGLTPSSLGPLAAPLLLVRVALGLEWLTGALPLTRFSNPGAASLEALLLAAVAVALAAPGPAPRPKRNARAARRGASAAQRALPSEPDPVPAGAGAGVRAGLIWALAGALPVTVVAPVWSAYYFLFATAGVGLALGSWLTRMRWRGPAAAALVALAGFASTQARGLEEFATAPSSWSGQSHVNRFYLERGMRVITRCVADLRKQAPSPAPHTTFFFAGLPAFASFQVADGPLVRGVYRDSSLRGYYLSQFTRERMARGPWRIFVYDAASGRLFDRTREHGIFMSMALAQVLDGRTEVAEAALEAASANGEDAMGRAYLAGLVATDRGEIERARRLFESSGRAADSGGAGADIRARSQLATGDSLGALLTLRRVSREHVLNAGLHALMADLMLARPESKLDGEFEAYAARVLAPTSPVAWRRWAGVLALEGRRSESIAAFDHYFLLDPAAGARDSAAIRMRALQARMLPGGDLAQTAMKMERHR